MGSKALLVQHQKIIPREPDKKKASSWDAELGKPKSQQNSSLQKGRRSNWEKVVPAQNDSLQGSKSLNLFERICGMNDLILRQKSNGIL